MQHPSCHLIVAYVQEAVNNMKCHELTLNFGERAFSFAWNAIVTITASLPGRVVVWELIAERFSRDRLWRDN